MLISGFNLATSNYRQSRREMATAACVLVILGVLLAGQVAFWASGRGERRALAVRLDRMEEEFRRHQEKQRAAQAGVPTEAIKRYEAKVAAYNRILEASAFSWTGLLLELERAVPPSVSLSEIQPELPTGQVKLRGVARSFDDLSLFLRGLEQRTVFRDVYLLHQAERKAAPGSPEGLDFSVSLLYQGHSR